MHNGQSKLYYIHLNPVKAGIVSKASTYNYSSANNYREENKGVLPLTLASNAVIDVLKTVSIKNNNY